MYTGKEDSSHSAALDAEQRRLPLPDSAELSNALQDAGVPTLLMPI